MSSKFNVYLWYFDDGTLAGDPETVRSDFEKILSEKDSLGLRVNTKKCELSVLGSDPAQLEQVSYDILSQYLYLKLVPTEEMNLLDVPLFTKGIDNELTSRLETLQLTC